MVKPQQGAPGKKPKAKRKTYSMAFKQKVRHWRIIDKIKPMDIQKLLEEEGQKIPLSTCNFKTIEAYST